MRTKPSILCVDDDPGILASLKLELSERYDLWTAQTGDEAKQIFQKNHPDLVILDVHLDQDDGIALLSELKRKRKHVQYLMLTGDRDSQSIAKALKIGAVDYITKPFEKDDLHKTVEKSIRKIAWQFDDPIYDSSSEPVAKEYIGRSENVQKLRLVSQKVANAEVNVLIIGESGTGKEVLSRYIHSMHKKNSRPFVALNCAAIPSELMESIMFGHEKGAFTGADRQKIGKFELANGGDIFLDEIGSMPLHLQSKLLRVLQEKEFERVGGHQMIQSNFRVIAATNRDLRIQIQEGTFREDLYYRLSVVQLHLEPLRERREDIPLLIDYYLERTEHNQENKTIHAETKARLSSMDWPGNARQLFNVIDAMLVLSDHRELTSQDIPAYVLENTSPASSTANKPMNQFEQALDAYEKQLIQKALDQAFGQKQKASTLLGISRSSLIRRMKRLQMMK